MKNVLKYQYFLTNVTDNQITIVTGIDGNPGSSITPTFSMRGGFYTPSSSRRLAFINAQQLTLNLEPGKEIMIGRYITILPVGLTKDSDVIPKLFLRTKGHDLEYIVEFESAKHVEQER